MAETQPQQGNDVNPLAALGHPVHLFIDTSTLERMQFPFGLPRLQPLMDRLAAGDIRVVIPDVVAREIREHVSAHVEKAEKAHARFRRDASITRIVADPGAPAVAPDVDWQAIRTGAAAAVDRFLDDPGVEVLPIDGHDASEVFNDYFACRAPFGEGKKKSKFPDAFAMKGLLRYAQTEQCRIAVVSGDRDWQAACVDHDQLIGCASLEQVVDHSQVAEALLHEEIRGLLESHRGELEAAVVASFADRGFYWDSDEGHDSEVVETYDEEVESWLWSVIAIEDGWADIAGDARIRFRATASYPDPNSCYRDSDTKELIFFGQEHATLTSTVNVPVTLRVNVELLRGNALEFEELVVNDNGDIWFSEDEIENVRADNERDDE